MIPTVSFLKTKTKEKTKLKTNKLHKITAILFTMILCGSFLLSAEGRYTKGNNFSVSNPDTPYESKSGEEIVSNPEEIETPIRKKGPGIFYDDFNRRVANAIRKEAKSIYEQQEKAKELTSMDDVIFPIIKISNLYDTHGNSYLTYFKDQEFQSTDYHVYFIDALGRKLSDMLAPQANKIYEEQKKKSELTSWTKISIKDILYFIGGMIHFIIVVMIIFFAATLFYRKVIKHR